MNKNPNNKNWKKGTTERKNANANAKTKNATASLGQNHEYFNLLQRIQFKNIINVTQATG